MLSVKEAVAVDSKFSIEHRASRVSLTSQAHIHSWQTHKEARPGPWSLPVPASFCPQLQEFPARCRGLSPTSVTLCPWGSARMCNSPTLGRATYFPTVQEGAQQESWGQLCLGSGQQVMASVPHEDPVGKSVSPHWGSKLLTVSAVTLNS